MHVNEQAHHPFQSFQNLEGLKKPILILAKKFLRWIKFLNLDKPNCRYFNLKIWTLCKHAFNIWHGLPVSCEWDWKGILAVRFQIWAILLKWLLSPHELGFNSVVRHVRRLCTSYIFFFFKAKWRIFDILNQTIKYILETSKSWKKIAIKKKRWKTDFSILLIWLNHSTSACSPVKWLSRWVLNPILPIITRHHHRLSSALTNQQYLLQRYGSDINLQEFPFSDIIIKMKNIWGPISPQILPFNLI